MMTARYNATSRFLCLCWVAFVALAWSSCSEDPAEGPSTGLALRSPVALSVTLLNDITADVRWIDPNDYSSSGWNAVRYEVQISTDSVRFLSAGLVPHDSTRAFISRPFSEDTVYFFRVRILGPDAESPFSLVRSLAPPQRPRIQILVSDIAEMAVTLQWSSVADSVTTTVIQMKAGTSGEFVPVDTVDGAARSAIVGGPYTADLPYYFKVEALTNLGVHYYSDTATAMLLFPAPYALQVSFVADTAVSVSWKLDNPSAQHVVIEYIHWRTTTYELVIVDTVSAAQKSCVAPGRFTVDPRGYRFHAYAISQYNRSGISSYVYAYVSLPAPTGLAVTQLSDSAITFAWNDESSYETGFELLQSVDNGTYVVVDSSPAGSVEGTYLFAGAHDLVYRYRVRARSLYNVSALSSGVLILFDQSSGTWSWSSIP